MATRGEVAQGLGLVCPQDSAGFGEGISDVPRDVVRPRLDDRRPGLAVLFVRDAIGVPSGSNLHTLILPTPGCLPA